jgi:hypothetical protein
VAEHRCQPPAIGGGAVVQQPDWTCVVCGRGWRHCWTQAGTQWWAEVRGPAGAEHPTPEDRLNTIRTANAYMDDQAGVVEELTAQLRQALRERDEVRKQAAHWQDAQREERRKKRHVSGLLSEALSARRALEAEVPKALYRTGLGEVLGRGVMAEDVPLIAQLLPTWSEGT